MLSVIPFFIVLAVSIFASIKASKKEKDFFLAGRSIRWPMLLGTLLGTQLGGGFILGNTDAAREVGFSGCFYGIGLAIGLVILGLSYGRRLRRLEVSTLSELLERKYQSPALQKVSGILSVLSLGGISMCQAIGLKKF